MYIAKPTAVTQVTEKAHGSFVVDYFKYCKKRLLGRKPNAKEMSFQLGAIVLTGSCLELVLYGYGCC